MVALLQLKPGRSVALIGRAQRLSSSSSSARAEVNLIHGAWCLVRRAEVRHPPPPACAASVPPCLSYRERHWRALSEADAVALPWHSAGTGTLSPVRNRIDLDTPVS